MSGNRQKHRNPVRAARRRVAEWLGGLLIASIAIACNASVSPASGADESLPENASPTASPSNDESKPASAPATPSAGESSPSPKATDAGQDKAGKSNGVAKSDATSNDAAKSDAAKAEESKSGLDKDDAASQPAGAVQPTNNAAATEAGDAGKGNSTEASNKAEVIVETAADKAIPTTTVGPRPLSVRPEIEHQFPKIDYAARPRWVEAMPNVIGTVHVVAVSSGPWESPATAMERLDEELKKAADKYATELLEDPQAAARAAITAKEIRQRLTTDDLYAEVVEVEVGRMHQVHARLQFDDNFRDLIRQRWRQAVTRGRLGVFGTGFLVVFASLVAVFGYFKLDTATRGYYSRRLQLLTGVAILSSVTVGVVLARHYFSQ